MKILITGASGFIGQSLVRKLHKDHQIYALSRQEPSKLIKDLKNIVFINLDLIKNSIYDFECDYIIHAAAISKTGNFSDNVIMMKNLLEWASKKKVKYFLNLSSITIYANNDDKSIDEYSKTFKPNLYGQSKLDSEKILEKFANSKNIKAISIRLCGVVGIDAKDIFVTNLVQNVIDKKDINIYSKTALFNNIIHVSSITDYAFQFPIVAKKNYDFFNVGASNPMKLESVCKLIFAAFKFKSNIEEKKIGKKPFIIDISKAKKNKFIINSTRQTIYKYISDIKEIRKKN